MDINTANNTNAYEQAIQAYRRGNVSQALELLHRVLQSHPNNAAAHYAVAQCLIRMDDASQAEQHLREVVRLHPTHYVATFELGCLLQRSGRYPEAAKVFQDVLAQRRDHAGARARLDEVNATIAAHAARARPTGQQKRKQASKPTSPWAVRGETAPPDGHRATEPLLPPPPGPPSPSHPQTAAPTQALLPAEPSEVIAKPAGSSLAKDIEQHNVAYRGAELHKISPVVRYYWTHMAEYGVVALAVAWLSSVGSDLASSLSAPDLIATIGALLGVLAALLALGIPGWLIIALVRAQTYEARFTERCVEIHHGLLNRRKLVIWYYNVGDLSYVRNVRTYLSHTAGLRIAYKEHGEAQEIRLDGYGSPAELQGVFHDLQTHLLRERKQFKGVLLD